MTGELSKNFHGVGIGSLSKILAVKNFILMKVRVDDGHYVLGRLVLYGHFRSLYLLQVLILDKIG